MRAAAISTHPVGRQWQSVACFRGAIVRGAICDTRLEALRTLAETLDTVGLAEAAQGVRGKIPSC